MADHNNITLPDIDRKIFTNFNGICRFCLRDTPNGVSVNDKCLPEESKELESESVYNFITKLRIVEVNSFKNFPSKICEKCYEMVKLFYSFCQVCQKSDNLLRKCFESASQETKAQLNFKNGVKDQIGEHVPELELGVVENINQSNSFSILCHRDLIENHRKNFLLLSEKISEAQTLPNSIHESAQACDQQSNAMLLDLPNEILGQNMLRTICKCNQCENYVKSLGDAERLKCQCNTSHESQPAEDLLKGGNQMIEFYKTNFFCFHCIPYKQFQTQSQLVEHLEECHNENQSRNRETVFCCFLCPQAAFSSRLDLNEHLVKMHGVKEGDIMWNDVKAKTPMFFCMSEKKLDGFDVNELNISPRKDLGDEDVEHEGVWNWPESCETYSKNDSLHCRLSEEHSLEATKCPECSESFPTNRRLIQHGIKVHQKYFALFHHVFKKVLRPSTEERREKSFECDICRKRYICKTSLRKHILGAHLRRAVQDAVSCSYCGKTFSNKPNLKSHIEFVHEVLFVSCPLCKKKVNFKTIGKHYKTHSANADVSPGNHLCNTCGKVLKSKKSLEDHQKLHQNIRDEICDVCGSGFTTKKLLRLHKKAHEAVARKMFACDQCEKVFSGRHTLSRHRLTHSGKKNFICEVCSNCFYTIQELNRHLRHHKKDYKFDCELCDMRFLCKSSFRLHMMKHRNVRPHKCQFCDKMFIQRAKMKMHMAAKHNVDVNDMKTVWKDPKTYVPLDELLKSKNFSKYIL